MFSFFLRKLRRKLLNINKVRDSLKKEFTSYYHICIQSNYIWSRSLSKCVIKISGLCTLVVRTIKITYSHFFSEFSHRCSSVVITYPYMNLGLIRILQMLTSVDSPFKELLRLIIGCDKYINIRKFIITDHRQRMLFHSKHICIMYA